MSARLVNIASVLFGGLIAISYLRLLLNHQYAVLNYNIFTDNPKRWIPTIVPLFVGIWLFVFGLVGLIDEMRRTRSKSK